MKFDYRPVISGRRRDVTAVALRAGLRVASWFYALASRLRNRRYDSGKADVGRSDAVVISVGNLTTGGTGKTPVVCFLAKWLRRRGKRVAIVSRGYGRGDADMNDEAMELHARLPDVPHVQDADRVEAARIAVEELESEVILMDDGFQHRRLHRDLDIVLIDASCPFGFGYTLPRGLLREPVAGLRRADLVLITRCGPHAKQVAGRGDVVGNLSENHSAAENRRPDRSSSESASPSEPLSANQLADLVATVKRRTAPETPIFLSDHRPTGLLEYPGTFQSVDSADGKPVAVIAGIGNPDAFAHTVAECGMRIVARYDLPDHDAYSPETVAKLRAWVAAETSAELVVCTHKDLVKLQTDMLGGLPLRALTIELVLVDGEESFAACVEHALTNEVDKSQIDTSQ